MLITLVVGARNPKGLAEIQAPEVLRPAFKNENRTAGGSILVRHADRLVHMTDVTRILSAIQQGDTKASDHLMRLVYHELRKLAAARLYAEEDKGISIQPTLLVHEAYLRLVDADTQQGWCGRGHFFAAAAEAMRRILVESARRKASLKHGGAMRRVDLGLELADGKQLGDDILALNEALTRLETQWPEKALLVKLRYFSGLTISEASRELGISTATAERHWRFARAWLHTQLTAND